jgi:hypothetical protein
MIIENLNHTNCPKCKGEVFIFGGDGTPGRFGKCNFCYGKCDDLNWVELIFGVKPSFDDVRPLSEDLHRIPVKNRFENV